MCVCVCVWARDISLLVSMSQNNYAVTSGYILYICKYNTYMYIYNIQYYRIHTPYLHLYLQCVPEVCVLVKKFFRFKSLASLGGVRVRSKVLALGSISCCLGWLGLDLRFWICFRTVCRGLGIFTIARR